MIVPPIFLSTTPARLKGLSRHSTTYGFETLILFYSEPKSYKIQFQYRPLWFTRKYPSEEILNPGAIRIQWNVMHTRNTVTPILTWNDYWFHGRSYGQIDNRETPCYAELQGQPILEEEVDE